MNGGGGDTTQVKGRPFLLTGSFTIPCSGNLFSKHPLQADRQF